MTAFCLKIVAIISMTIDHAAVIIGQTGLQEIFTDLSFNTSLWVIHIMRGIGRAAFPLFAFMLAEGAKKSRSMPKYIGRLALFAFISEPFFYCAFSSKTPSLGGFLDNLSGFNFSNVFFTLALAAAVIYAYQVLERKKTKNFRLLFAMLCLITALTGEYIGCDYGMMGIFLIVALYFAKTKAQTSAIILVWSFVLYIIMRGVSVYSVINCLCASASCVLIWNYNGKRGKPIKWSFYIYYPAHLLLLFIAGAVI